MDLAFGQAAGLLGDQQRNGRDRQHQRQAGQQKEFLPVGKAEAREHDLKKPQARGNGKAPVTPPEQNPGKGRSGNLPAFRKGKPFFPPLSVALGIPNSRMRP
ncbi:hypothetical protein KU6B_26400 [Mameliella alba]|nr:hypothetical protein KU6B_26400 [Mameliella alba]